MTAGPLLRATDVVVGYGDQAPVLRGVTVDVEAGECVAIVGVNGTGKSTLLNTLAGFVPRREGRVELDGRRVDGLPPHGLVRAGLRLLPEGRSTLQSLTVRENLLLAYQQRDGGRQARNLGLDEAFRRFPVLEERQLLPAGVLSGGEQQMVALARALLGRPRMLLLDEPVLGLAPIIATEIYDTLRTIKEETQLSILLVEQDVARAASIADRLFGLIDGSLVAVDPGSSLAEVSHLMGLASSQEGLG